MSLTARLRLDDVVTSFPELGPTVPDGGYAWIVLCGVFLIQMTVPSVLTMYGVVLAYMHENGGPDFNVWNEKIILTPIIFIAFWNLADPWTRMIVSMATIPCLVGIIGVILLAVGIIASGYLATGGVGAYLASTSAGAVMGIGASLLILSTDYLIRKYFRKKLLLALTLRNISVSFGLVLIPIATNLLLHDAKLKTGLQLMTILLIPTALGTLTFRSPPAQETSPYSLLLSTEEDTELPIRVSLNSSKDSPQQNIQVEIENFDYNQTENRIHGGGLLNEGSNIYAYEEFDEDVDLFVSPVSRTNKKWTQQLRGLKTFRFWATTIGWFAVETGNLFFWIFIPFLSSVLEKDSYVWMSLSIVAGLSTFLPNLISYKILTFTNQNRRLYFGVACWICGFSFIGLIHSNNYSWMLLSTILGGLSIGCISSCQDLALYDVLGSETVQNVHKSLSTIVGLCVLLFCFVHDVSTCLHITAVLQFLGGLYWISSPALNLIKATRYRFRATNSRMNRDDT